MIQRNRVLRLITRLNIGGPARQALMLTKELTGFETTLGAGFVQEREGELSDPGVPVRRLPFVRPISPARDVAAYRAVHRLLSQEGPALVHTHMAKAGTIGRAASLRSKSKPRTVHTFHGHVLEGYFRGPSQRIFVAIERSLGKRTDVLIAVSTEIRDQLLDLGIGTPRRWEVIPLGFDLSAFLQEQGHTRVLRDALALGNQPLIVVLGRLAPIKDHETMLRAMVSLSGAHLAVLGDGELRPQLETLAHDLGIADRVHFVGWRTDVADVIADSDVVALTSRNEGSPVSLIEALATGRPVVATDVGGVRSVVTDGETGFLVPPGAPGAVASAVQQLLSSTELREKFGRTGRADVRSRYDKERLLSDIHALYSDLVGEAGNQEA